MLHPVDGIDTQSTESEIGDVNWISVHQMIMYYPVSKARKNPQIPNQNQR